MSEPEAFDDMLVAALELAVVVAQVGLRAVPPLEPPVSLKPFLRFTHKVPRPALRVARKVLDTDEAYRQRVCLVATEELIGAGGMLFVTRPEGWEEQLADLRQQDDTGQTEAAEVSNRKLDKKLAGLEAARDKAEKAHRQAKDDLSIARSALQDERRQRAQLAKDVARLDGLVAAKEAELTHLRELLTARDSENATLQAIVQRITGERDRAVQESIGRGRIQDTIATALRSLDDVRDALLDFGSKAPDEPKPEPRRPTPSKSTRARWVDAGNRPSSGRQPTALPPAVFDDSNEAARHLLKVPGMVVLVDGYNVAKFKWPEVSASELRMRLVSSLGAVATKTGSNMHIIFDGIGEGTSAIAGSGRVRVTFTKEGEEADDLILTLVAQLPISQPVMVVSSDKRVQDGARSLGANVVTTPTFVEAW